MITQSIIMKNRYVSFFIITVTACLLALSGSFRTMNVYADNTAGNYQYLDLDGNLKDVPADQIRLVVTGHQESAEWNDDGWIIIDGEDITVDHNILINGNVKLLLCDGAKLNSAVSVNSGSLTIYGQSGQSGTLNASSNDHGISVGTDVTVNGGVINAGSDYNGAIYDREGSNTFTVNYGTVTANSFNGCGIDANTVRINGGTVKAESQNNHGILARNGNLTINGGDVDARSTGRYGIVASGSNVEIYGGSVYTKGVAGIAVGNVHNRIVIGENITRVKVDYDKDEGERALMTLAEVNNRPILVNAVEGRGYDRDDPSHTWYRIDVHDEADPFDAGDYGYVVFPLPPVTIESSDFGTVTADYATGIPGETFVLHVTPDEDCILTSISCITEDGSQVTINGNDGEYSFEMPDSPVTVHPVFSELHPKPKKFTVTYVVENGTWADGTSTPKTEEVEEGQSLALIPTDMVADENYEGGAWDTDPNTATITEAMTFTYTFTEKAVEVPDDPDPTSPTSSTDPTSPTPSTSSTSPTSPTSAGEPDTKPVSIANAKVILSETSFTYKGKVQKPVIKSIGGKLLQSGTDYTAKWSNASSKNAGTYTVTITGKGSYTGQTKATYTIKKAANPLKVKAKTAKVKAKTLKEKEQILKVSKVMTFTKKGQGKMKYTLSAAKKGKKSFKKYFKINARTGTVMVRKGLKKGSYKVKVKVKAFGNKNYKASKTMTVTFKISVK